MLRKHVLAINSEPDFLDVIRQLLQEERYNVTTTNHVGTTFAAILATDADLILIDLRFGQDAGWDLLVQLVTDPATSSLPLIAASTDESLLARAKALPHGTAPRGFLLKPFELGDLVDLVQSLIGSA